MKKHIINLSCLMLVASMTLLFSCTEEETEPEKSTNLKIIVTEENGTFVENAVVKIFTNENDWANNQNAAYPKQTTSAAGEVMFEDIEPDEYWIGADKGNKNNWFTTKRTDGNIPADQTTTIEVVIK